MWTADQGRQQVEKCYSSAGAPAPSRADLMAGIVHARIEELIERLGVSTALRLAKAFGGRRLYVPECSHVDEGHPIARAIGLEAARKVAEEWRSLEIAVPRCAAQLRSERDRALRADRAHLSISKVAEKYALCERNVLRICAKGADSGHTTAPNPRKVTR
jgi:hypothetical protein